MPDTTPRRGPGRPPRPLPEVIARVVLSSPLPAEWDYQTGREGENAAADDADGAAV